MAPNLLDEKPIPLSEARKNHIPKRNDRAIAPSTVTRWIHKGIRAGDGTIVRLEAVKIDKSLMTTRESIRRFFTTLTERSTFAQADQPNDDSQPSRERPVRELEARNLL